MQIVIDIPDEVYEEIQVKFLNTKVNPITIIDRAIYNGTPLPKGYGRLIDADAYYDSIKEHYFDNSTVMRCTEIALDNAPTIIGADEAESAVDMQKNEVNNILDKISVEIEKLETPPAYQGEDYFLSGVNACLDIINKYRS